MTIFRFLKEYTRERSFYCHLEVTPPLKMPHADGGETSSRRKFSHWPRSIKPRWQRSIRTQRQPMKAKSSNKKYFVNFFFLSDNKYNLFGILIYINCSPLIPLKLCILFSHFTRHKTYNLVYANPRIRNIKGLTPWLMEPRDSMSHSQGLSNNSWAESTQFPALFKVHSNIVLPSTPRPTQRSLSCRFN